MWGELLAGEQAAIVTRSMGGSKERKKSKHSPPKPCPGSHSADYGTRPFCTPGISHKYLFYSIACLPSVACRLLPGHCTRTSTISHTTMAPLVSKCKHDHVAPQLKSQDCLSDTWIKCRVWPQQSPHSQCSLGLAAPHISRIFALAPPLLVF